MESIFNFKESIVFLEREELEDYDLIGRVRGKGRTTIDAERDLIDNDLKRDLKILYVSGFVSVPGFDRSHDKFYIFADAYRPKVLEK